MMISFASSVACSLSHHVIGRTRRSSKVFADTVLENGLYQVLVDPQLHLALAAKPEVVDLLLEPAADHVREGVAHAARDLSNTRKLSETKILVSAMHAGA